MRKSIRKMLKEETTRLLNLLKEMDPKSNEYKITRHELERISLIIKAKDENYQRILPTVLGVAGNIAGILLVMNFEKLNVVTTKALGIAFKPKIL